MSKSKVG